MRAISAADAISPAIQRTREFLFRPFSWGTYLKLGLVAIITEGFGSSLRSGSHGGPSPQHGPTVHSPLHLHPGWVAAIVAGALVATLLFIALFYVVTRLRFAFFHCLIHNTRQIRPGWRLYASQATRFFWLNIVVGFCFLLVIAVLALPFVAEFWQLIRQTPPGGRPDIVALLSFVLPLIPLVLLIVLAAIALDIILRDWMLPHFALENATAGEAWSRVWARIKAEKAQFFAYSLLRVVLPTIAVIALLLVMMVPGLLLVGAFAAFEFGLRSAFAGVTGPAAIFGILLQAFFGVIAFGFVLFAAICLGGPLGSGLREYALIFYGGRFKALGDILYPPPPPSSGLDVSQPA
jgi:hypothetical protein